jgi:putative transcriptional regulator
MTITAGTILTSTSSLDDDNFENTTIFIVEYNQKGAMGFVINKLFARQLNQLEEFKQCIAFPLYNGGPVQREHLFFIHQRPDLITGGLLITGSIYLGGNFKQAVTLLNHNIIGKNDTKIFIGYCGWDYMQLEEEVEEGSWIISNADSQFIFCHPESML